MSPEMAFPGKVNADILWLFLDYFCGYSYQDVIEQWGRPDEETDGIGAVQYNIDIFSYVELLFDSDGIVNDIRLVSELPALEDITLENAEEIKAKLIGNYKEPNFSVAWGRPDGQGSGMYFETWYSSKGVHITIYFDNTTNDAVDVIISDSIVAPEDAWRFTEQLRAHLIGEVDYNWFAEKWGKPDGQLSGFWGDIWQATDNVQIVVYYDANGVVEEIITHSELLGKQAFSTDMLDRLKEQTVGKYTIGEVEHFWAPAEPDNTGADNRRYEISENTFVVFSYDDESGLITDVEILCRTPKADE